ncbi:hypothetical protein GYMLUDRAFT_245163 [Collybiopsis luxurians FD-317 M1]|uniref:Uncharacterized protein n=1 Tax=Collybiopsis luxurians FD-317 M1 TaxID=944289 RepID=A0A0D0CLP4_9AGAR|nr:hypothetical protein GYMLUDRAFT_245163 [Collybiopsis luxurians FD-317 M1]
MVHVQPTLDNTCAHFLTVSTLPHMLADWELFSSALYLPQFCTEARNYTGTVEGLLHIPLQLHILKRGSTSVLLEAGTRTAQIHDGSNLCHPTKHRSLFLYF